MQISKLATIKRTWLYYFLLLLFFSHYSHAAPRSELWPMWQQSNERSTATINNQLWQGILDNYLIMSGENTLFDYRRVSTQDKQRLKQYIKQLTSTDPRTLNKKEQFAYWVNLYNALTVDLILDNYPIKSIKNLGGFFSSGPWDDDVAVVAGTPITLNDIEHRILRPIWKDPRIHYAVNCASLGCPNLNPRAYDAQNTERLLNQSAIEFLNSAKGVSIQGNTLYLSSIFDWYGSDFGSNEQEVLRAIDQYRTKQKIANWSGKIKYQYDWALNQP